jgi:hypothetical protein
MGVSLDTVLILAYAKTAQGGWRFWPFQVKALFDPTDRVADLYFDFCAYPFLRSRRLSVSLLH